MKPKEFDELVRQKFDQNDFEYNPGNWDRLAEELDGRSKKRSVIMWWWLPLTGVAASVALAIGVTTMIRQDGPARNIAKTELVQKHISIQAPSYQQQLLPSQAIAINNEPKHSKPVNKQHKAITVINKEIKEQVAIQYHEPANIAASPDRTINLLNIGSIPSKEKEKEVVIRKKQVTMTEGVNTFRQTEVVKKAPKLSIILSGGVNRGSQSNGYMAGATIRRMVNDKVFVEGDIALSNSNNSQLSSVPAVADGQNARHSAARTAANASDKATTTTYEPPVVFVSKDEVKSFTLAYAQVTPCIGYKLMKRMAIAAGPDFQQALADNRPTTSINMRDNLQQTAMFDMGIIGKTEYSITRNVKAAVSYRKGINTIIIPTDKYLDRDYLQFQVKCAIFNK
jgi:hypothetical protein